MRSLAEMSASCVPCSGGSGFTNNDIDIDIDTEVDVEEVNETHSDGRSSFKSHRSSNNSIDEGTSTELTSASPPDRYEDTPVSRKGMDKIPDELLEVPQSYLEKIISRDSAQRAERNQLQLQFQQQEEQPDTITNASTAGDVEDNDDDEALPELGSAQAVHLETVERYGRYLSTLLFAALVYAGMAGAVLLYGGVLVLCGVRHLAVVVARANPLAER